MPVSNACVIDRQYFLVKKVSPPCISEHSIETPRALLVVPSGKTLVEFRPSLM